MIQKVCSWCGEIRPASDFVLDARVRGGLGSHCRQCRNERNRAWKDRNPDYAEMQNETRNGRYRPIPYSRSVCAHVAAYLERAAERFEKNTGQEAPPHIAALRDIASRFVLEHPEINHRQVKCADCGVEFIRSPKQRYHICPPCSIERKRARWRAKNHRRRGKAPA